VQTKRTFFNWFTFLLLLFRSILPKPQLGFIPKTNYRTKLRNVSGVESKDLSVDNSIPENDESSKKQVKVK